MRTGIYADEKGSPLEALIHTLKDLPKITYGGLYEDVCEVISEKIYFEQVLPELYKLIPKEILDKFLELYAPENVKYRFSDDTILSIATMDAILKYEASTISDKLWINFFQQAYYVWANKFPKAGYGKDFITWFGKKNSPAYNSKGNGAAMRIAPIGYLYSSKKRDRFQTSIARDSCRATHNHPEGIRGALAVAHAVYLANIGMPKPAMQACLEGTYYYDLGRTLDSIRPTYSFSSWAESSVPEALIAFFEADSGIGAIENSFSLRGDTDTMGLISGCVADAFWGYNSIPQVVHETIEKSLTPEMMAILERFENKYILN